MNWIPSCWVVAFWYRKEHKQCLSIYMYWPYVFYFWISPVCFFTLTTSTSIGLILHASDFRRKLRGDMLWFKGALLWPKKIIMIVYNGTKREGEAVSTCLTYVPYGLAYHCTRWVMMSFELFPLLTLLLHIFLTFLIKEHISKSFKT